MSYLNPLRLHFAGKFQAAVSTVNNDPQHFDNSKFDPAFQQRQTDKAPNGWWNPQGDASWRLLGCKVTSAWTTAGDPVDSSDLVLGLQITDSNQQVAAKLVDLDPMQQLVSEIWGMQIRICKPDGTNLLQGTFETAAFYDIWDRAASGGGDIGACAAYQSVLTELEWGDVAESTFLAALQKTAANGMLSIKFNVDGYNMSFGSPDFTKGRVVGTIGPYVSGEPWHFVAGRHMMAREAPKSNFFTPQGGINFCQAKVDADMNRIFLDLGNALPTKTAGGCPSDLGILSAGCVVMDEKGQQSFLPLGDIDYMRAGWYETTAGVVAVPPDRALTADELTALASAPLCLTLKERDPAAQSLASKPKLAIVEDVAGLYVRADRFVYRMSPGDNVVVPIYATRFGKPHRGATIVCHFDNSQLQGEVGKPADAILMGSNGRIKTDQDGRTELVLTASDPGGLRDFIDGQLFGIRPALEETLGPAADYPFNKWDFISVLLWNAFPVPAQITWAGGLDQIFQQYANLYPVMKRFLDLSDYDSVSQNLDLLTLSFSLPPEDPNSMPVTRDLSPAKRAAILQWLVTLGPDGKPIKGTATQPVAAAASLRSALPASSPTTTPDRGGKTAAMERRVCMRRPRLYPGEPI